MSDALTQPEKEALALARWLKVNCRQCPSCGSWICGELDVHQAWHEMINTAWQGLVNAATQKIQDHDALFQQVAAKFVEHDGLFQQAATKLAQHDANFTTAQNLITGLTTRVAVLEARLPAVGKATGKEDNAT